MTGNGNEELGIDRKIKLGWVLYGKMKDVLEMSIPLKKLGFSLVLVMLLKNTLKFNSTVIT